MKPSVKVTKNNDIPKLKTSASQLTRHMPPKNEVKQIKSRLIQVTKAASEYNKPVEKDASKVYANTNEVVTNSTFESTKTVGPRGQSFAIGNDLLNSQFNNS